LLRTKKGQAIKKIWFDILTPKDLPFFAPMIRRLEPECKLLLTSRRYGEVTSLAKIHGTRLEVVGRHGGRDLLHKLRANTERISLLTDRVLRFKPDVTVSFCSPEAARVSFGLGIKHVAFYDAPHATAILKLTVPFVQKLMVPYMIPKKRFSIHGIDPSNIIQYRAIDAAVTIKRDVDRSAPLPFRKNHGRNILIRTEESHASYEVDTRILEPIARKMVSEFGRDNNVVVLARYTDQARALAKKLRGNVKIVMMKYDGVHLLENTDAFIGSGGTMTYESALMGVPTVSYGAVPNITEQFLARKRLINVESDPGKVAAYVQDALASDPQRIRSRANKLLSQMTDPTDDLINAIREL